MISDVSAHELPYRPRRSRVTPTACLEKGIAELRFHTYSKASFAHVITAATRCVAIICLAMIASNLLCLLVLISMKWTDS